MYAKMLFKIFLLLSLVCVSYSSRAKIAEKLAECTDIFSALGLAEQITQVKHWKVALDKIESIDDADAVAIASDMEKCQAKLKSIKSPNILTKFLVENMHDLFMMKKAQHQAMKECTTNSDAESKLKEMKLEKKILHETNGKIAKKIALCKSEMAEMKQNHGAWKNEMEQNAGEIINLKKMAKQLMEEIHKIRAKNVQFATKVEQEKQMVMELAQQLRNEQKMHRECGQKNNDLSNANSNWKITTFVLIGGVALLLLILAISVGLFLKDHFKA